MTRVRGFSFAGLHCGVKDRAPDLALVVSDRPAAAAGTFTRSTVPGAPVVLSKRHIRNGVARGIVVNSGVSNVAMGQRGARDAEAMAAEAAGVVGCRPGDMLVASTGVIGEPLPMARIRRGIHAAADALAPDGLARAAEAILTTDTVAKVAHRSFRLRGRTVRVAGMAKGSGMIQPNMATMLAFVLTDAAVASGYLKRVWREVVEDTFNRVTIDGETSTSDTAIVLANGASETAPIRGPRSGGARGLREALHGVATDLARALARDGEGATKLVTVEVSGARSAAQAELAARRVANSVLVKTALFGGDPNWGRILQAVGAGEVAISLPRTEVRLAGVPVYQNGAGTGTAARKRAGRGLARSEVAIDVRLGAGRAKARIWTCDLTYDYVKINAEYTT